MKLIGVFRLFSLNRILQKKNSMDEVQWVRDVACTSLFAQQQAKLNPGNKDKIYMDAHSIGSNDNSVMNEVMLSGIYQKTKPFLEKVSYQIPASQYDLKPLFTLPHQNITEIFKLNHTQKSKGKDATLQEFAYHTNDKFYIYRNNTASEVNGFTNNDRLITRIINFPKILHIDPKFNVLLMNGCDDIHYPVKIYHSNAHNSISRIKPTDKIINFYTNFSISNPLQEESIFLIVFKHSVAVAKLKLMDYSRLEDDQEYGYEADYGSLYPSQPADIKKRYKLIIHKQITTEHLNIIDVTFLTKKMEIDGVNQNKNLPILLSADGRAYFYNETFNKILLQISSINNQLFKAHIFDCYCILYNSDEMIMINMNTFKPSNLKLNISPKHMFDNMNSLFILESNSTIYKLNFKQLIKPIPKIDRFKFKLGLPLRILPLRAKHGRTLILSQHDYNGETTKRRDGLSLSLFNNQSMQVVKTLKLHNTSGVAYTFMEPLLADHSSEGCYWEDTVVLTYQVPNHSKSYWYIVKIIRGREIKILIEGSLHSTITSIFTNLHSIDGNIKICMSTDTGVNYFLLSHEQGELIIKEEGKSPQPADVFNVGGFYQNGIMHLVNPYYGLLLNMDLHSDINVMKDAQHTVPQLFGDDPIIKVATKSFEQLYKIQYSVPLNSYPSAKLTVFDRFVDELLLSSKYNERKDFQKTFCAMLAADNFIYLYDDVSEILPNKALATRPILKFRPDQRIVNITPISQSYEASSFENELGMLPLFFLLGLEGAVYVLSVSNIPYRTNLVSSEETISTYENNCAPLWAKTEEHKNVKFSLRLVSSE